MSLTTIVQKIESGAEAAGIDLQTALKFLAEFSRVAAPIVVAIETVTNNSELVPITNQVVTDINVVNQVAGAATKSNG